MHQRIQQLHSFPPALMAQPRIISQRQDRGGLMLFRQALSPYHRIADREKRAHRVSSVYQPLRCGQAFLGYEPLDTRLRATLGTRHRRGMGEAWEAWEAWARHERSMG